MSARSSLVPLALLLAVTASRVDAGDLQSLTDKKITSTGKSLVKADKRLDGLEAHLSKRQASHDEALAAEAAAALAVDTAQDDLADAEAALAAAQELPAANAEEQAARASAIAEANATLKQAAKTLKKAVKASAKAVKSLARRAKALDKMQLRRDDGEDRVLDLQDDLDLLEGSFDFSSTRPVPLGLRVVDGEGTPLVGVQITITDPLVPPKKGKKGKKAKKVLEDVTSPFTYWQGFTDAEGRVDTAATVALAAEDVDVIVHAPGFVGEYTHLSLRDEWGPLAPAVRITRPTRDLESLDLVLELDD